MTPQEKARELRKTFKSDELAVEAVKLVLTVIPFNYYSVINWWEEVIITLKNNNNVLQTKN